VRRGANGRRVQGAVGSSAARNKPVPRQVTTDDIGPRDALQDDWCGTVREDFVRTSVGCGPPELP
jgi:hypothetical protein